MTTYRSDIDGLRAVAVLAVLAFHAIPQVFPGGFVGVDIFFVISGYLISSILLSSLQNQQFSLLDFYSRRIRRIFPALITVFIASFVLSWYFFYADEFINLGNFKGNGNSVYPVPSGVSVQQYPYVLIHCQQYNHLFAIAPLTQN